MTVAGIPAASPRIACVCRRSGRRIDDGSALSGHAGEAAARELVVLTRDRHIRSRLGEGELLPVLFPVVL